MHLFRCTVLARFNPDKKEYATDRTFALDRIEFVDHNANGSLTVTLIGGESFLVEGPAADRLTAVLYERC